MESGIAANHLLTLNMIKVSHGVVWQSQWWNQWRGTMGRTLPPLDPTALDLTAAVSIMFHQHAPSTCLLCEAPYEKCSP